MQLIGLSGQAGHGKDSIADYLVDTMGFVKFSFSDALYAEVLEAFYKPEGLTSRETREYLLRARDHKELLQPWLTLDECADEAFKEVARAKLRREGRGNGDPANLPADAYVDGYHLSPRWVLITWGTEYRRAQDPNYWVRKAHEFMKAFIDDNMKHIVVETDSDSERILWAEQLGMKDDPAVTLDEEGRAPIGTVLYLDHPGLVNTSVRFKNEVDWIRGQNGRVWQVVRPGFCQNADTAGHLSERVPELQTGDKLIINASSLEALHTGIALAMQGPDIVNTREEVHAEPQKAAEASEAANEAVNALH